MKMKNPKIYALILTFLGCFYSLSLAAAPGYVIYEDQITMLSMNSNFAYFKAVGSTNNPVPCSSSGTIILEKSHPSFREIYSLLMAAQIAKRKVRIYTTGCFSAWSSDYPAVTTMHLLD